MYLIILYKTRLHLFTFKISHSKRFIRRITTYKSVSWPNLDPPLWPHIHTHNSKSIAGSGLVSGKEPVVDDCSVARHVGAAAERACMSTQPRHGLAAEASAALAAAVAAAAAAASPRPDCGYQDRGRGPPQGSHSRHAASPEPRNEQQCRNQRVLQGQK